jgi:hypothetical protein
VPRVATTVGYRAEGAGFEHPAKTSRETVFPKPADAKSGAVDAELMRIVELWPQIAPAGQRRLLRLARRLALQYRGLRSNA